MKTNVPSAVLPFLFLMFFHLVAGALPIHAQTPADEAATTWRIDPTHSFVGFKVRHMGIASVTGEFKEYEADIALDPSDLSTLKTMTVIRTASIDTENDRRDNHLRSDDFFNAEEFPEMRFERLWAEVGQSDGGGRTRGLRASPAGSRRGGRQRIDAR